MNITNFKELEQLFKLCRKQGIEAMEIGEIKFNLGAAPKAKHKTSSISNDFPEASIKIPQYNPEVNTATTSANRSADKVITDELTPEQLMFYSSVDHTQETARAD